MVASVTGSHDTLHAAECRYARGMWPAPRPNGPSGRATRPPVGRAFEEIFSFRRRPPQTAPLALRGRAHGPSGQRAGRWRGRPSAGDPGRAANGARRASARPGTAAMDPVAWPGPATDPSSRRRVPDPLGPRRDRASAIRAVVSRDIPASGPARGQSAPATVPGASQGTRTGRRLAVKVVTVKLPDRRAPVGRMLGYPARGPTGYRRDASESGGKDHGRPGCAPATETESSEPPSPQPPLPFDFSAAEAQAGRGQGPGECPVSLAVSSP